jgi:hypothetical protein
MGLFMDCFDFDAEPPSRDELAAHLREQIGSERGLDAYEIDGRRATVYCMIDAITRPYALSFLSRRGGRRVDHRTGEPRPCEVPAFVDRPWREHSFWFRCKVHLGLHGALLRTIRRSPGVRGDV